MKTAFLLLVVGFGGACGGTSITVQQDAAPACKIDTAGIEVIGDNLYGYSPYASNGCRLVYVDRSTKELRLVINGATQVLAPGSEAPSSPTISDDVIAWIGVGDQLRVFANGETKTIISAKMSRATEPRATKGAIVFTGWMTDTECDVMVADVATGTVEVIGGGPAQQRFADISEDLVVYSDFSEDPDGRFDQNDTDLADIVIYDRKTKTAAKRALPGKQAFPIIADIGHIGYLSWADVHPEPKFQAYTLKRATISEPAVNDKTVADIKNAVSTVLPTARQGIIEYVAGDPTSYSGKAFFWRAAADGSTAPQQIMESAQSLGAPRADATLTLLGRWETAGPALIVVAR